VEQLVEIGLTELRTLRRQAREEEEELSYLRRLLQGRIDILRAELARRSGQQKKLLDQLPQILADTPSQVRRAVRHVTLALPRTAQYQSVVEEVFARVELSDLGARTDQELAAACGWLMTCEREVSRRRQDLQGTADSCGAEIGRRYREGEARVEDLLAGGF
jgi:hypothetical protein